MAEESRSAEPILQAALAIIAADGWRRLTMAAVAREGGWPLAEVYALFPSKAHLLSGLIARTDRAVLSGPPPDASEAPRDRVFDVLMRRFDALQADRAAYLRLIRELPRDPAAAVAFLPGFARAMAWMVEAAGLPNSGAAGALRCQGIALVYLNAVRVWATDDSPDMARTMAAVDKGLTRADTVVARIPGLASRSAPTGTAAAGAERS
jgi:AcrR family transcriptional regulator